VAAAGFIFQAPGLPDKLNRAQGTQVIDDQNSLRGDVNRFQTTRWSVVLVSAQSQAPGSEKALADLCITELARAFLNKGWHERAHEPIRKALELNPNDWRANRFAADELFGTARYDEMYVSLRKCYAVNPNDSYAPNLMGYICWIVDHFQRHAVGPISERTVRIIRAELRT
jgi:hypothetical protein